jgi:hypothetical protein
VKRRAVSAWWDEQMNPSHTTEADWRLEFRVPRTVFNNVVNAISSHMVFDAPVNVGARKLAVDKQLACFLLRIGGNLPVAKIRRRLGMSESSVTQSVRRVALAIQNRLGHVVSMPRNGTTRKTAVKAMFETAEYGLRDAVGIVDCTHIPCTVPVAERRAGNIAAYLDRKGRPTLTFQAITTPEASPRFLSLSGGVPGSAYDTRILQDSIVYKHLGEFLEGDEFLMGDCGYTLRPFMMRGWANTELKADDPLSKDRRSFNRFYSSVRISVERAFGILKARFRALSQNITMRNENDYRACVMACCILHNLCAEANAVRVFAFHRCLLFHQINSLSLALTPSPPPPTAESS